MGRHALRRKVLRVGEQFEPLEPEVFERPPSAKRESCSVRRFVTSLHSSVPSEALVEELRKEMAVRLPPSQRRGC